MNIGKIIGEEKEKRKKVKKKVKVRTCYNKCRRAGLKFKDEQL